MLAACQGVKKQNHVVGVLIDLTVEFVGEPDLGQGLAAPQLERTRVKVEELGLDR